MNSLSEFQKLRLGEKPKNIESDKKRLIEDKTRTIELEKTKLA